MKLVLATLVFLACSTVSSEAQTTEPFSFRGLTIGVERSALAELAQRAGWHHAPDGRHEYSIEDETLGRLQAEIRIYMSEDDPADTLIVDYIAIESEQIDSGEWRSLLPRMRTIRSELVTMLGEPDIAREDEFPGMVAPALYPPYDRGAVTVGTPMALWNRSGERIALMLSRKGASAWCTLLFESQPSGPDAGDPVSR